MTDSVFKIRDKMTGCLLDAVLHTGISVSSVYGREFQSYGEAYAYLASVQKNGFYQDEFFRLNRFGIEEYKLYPSQSFTVVDYTEKGIMDNPDSQDSIVIVNTLLKFGVKNGFSFLPEYFLNFLLTYDKYQSIINDIVPPHILQSVDEFMDVGIFTCDIDVLGSISLTATDLQLTMFKIVEVLQTRTQQQFRK